MAVPVVYFAAAGISGLKNNIKLWIFCPVFVYLIFSYLHIYYVHYPKRTSPDWSGGYREAIEFAAENEDNYDKILITDKMSQGYIYLKYYASPNAVVATGEKYSFVSSPFQGKIGGKVLYISPYWEQWDGTLLNEVKNKGGDLIFNIWEN